MGPVIREKLERCSSLPSLPAVAVQILDLCQRDDMKQIAIAIGRDPALAAKLIKTANSPMFSFRREVSTISHAVCLLGKNAVRTLVLSFSLVNNKKKSDCVHLENFWRRSLLAALAARQLAESIGEPGEQAFLAALLQDIGVLALARSIGGQYTQILQQANNDHDRLAELETVAYGSDHAEIGEWLLSRWRAPVLLAKVVGLSHKPERLPEQADEHTRKLTEVVYLAGRIADIWCSDSNTSATRLDTALRERWPGNQVKIDEINARLVEEAPELAALFEISLDGDEMGELLDAAQEALVALSVRASQEVQDIHDALQRLETRTAALLVEAQRDPLTGVANRGYMDMLLNEAFQEGSRSDAIVGVIFADIDHFKAVNDQYGHAAGDAILESVARRITESVRQGDLAGRYGGEEFVVLVRARNASEIEFVAESIRRAVGEKPHCNRYSGPVKVTVSLGSALLDRNCHTTPADWLCEADAAMYAAKRAGRNRHISSRRPTSDPVATQTHDLRATFAPNRCT